MKKNKQKNKVNLEDTSYWGKF